MERIAAIREHVLRALGRPIGLFRLQVRWLWGDNYRVNVLIGQDIASATVAHSYFVAAGSTNDLFRASPEIVKQYGARQPSVALADRDLPHPSSAAPA